MKPWWSVRNPKERAAAKLRGDGEKGYDPDKPHKKDLASVKRAARQKIMAAVPDFDPSLLKIVRNNNGKLRLQGIKSGIEYLLFLDGDATELSVRHAMEFERKHYISIRCPRGSVEHLAGQQE